MGGIVAQPGARGELPVSHCEPGGAEGPPRGLSLKALAEGLLFVADEPLAVERLAAVLEASVEEMDAALEELARECEGRGVRVQRKGQHVQMVTAPEAAEAIRRLLGLEASSKLSAAALETLAIVAYRQPATRAQIEAVRGVNSDSALRTLINHGLVEEAGRLDQAGRPMLFGTTFEFLQQFGMSSLVELPPLEYSEVQEQPGGA